MSDKSQRTSLGVWLAIAALSVVLLLSGYYSVYRLAREDYAIYLRRTGVVVAPIYSKTGIAAIDEPLPSFFRLANEFEEFRLENQETERPFERQ